MPQNLAKSRLSCQWIDIKQLLTYCLTSRVHCLNRKHSAEWARLTLLDSVEWVRKALLDRSTVKHSVEWARMECLTKRQGWMGQNGYTVLRNTVLNRPERHLLKERKCWLGQNHSLDLETQRWMGQNGISWGFMCQINGNWMPLRLKGKTKVIPEWNTFSYGSSLFFFAFLLFTFLSFPLPFYPSLSFFLFPFFLFPIPFKPFS